MYHAHEATKPHDKVYALLGMSSDNLPANLTPDYRVKLPTLLHRLVQYILGIHIPDSCWHSLGGLSQAIIAFQTPGLILGEVWTLPRRIIGWGESDREAVEFDVRHTDQPHIPNSIFPPRTTHWTVQAPAQPIKKGDIICLLKGSRKPTIVRRTRPYGLRIIVIAARPPENQEIPMTGEGKEGREEGELEWEEFLQGEHDWQNLYLGWDWESRPVTEASVFKEEVGKRGVDGRDQLDGETRERLRRFYRMGERERERSWGL